MTHRVALSLPSPSPWTNAIQNVTKLHGAIASTLARRHEGLFAEELALLQPTPGYMRLLKESVLPIWKARKAAVREELANADRVTKLSLASWTAFQQLFFPDGIAFDGKSFVRTGVTAPAFSYLREISTENEG